MAFLMPKTGIRYYIFSKIKQSCPAALRVHHTLFYSLPHHSPKLARFGCLFNE
jgi:hypothetical protein